MNVDTNRKLQIYSNLPGSCVEALCGKMWSDVISSLIENLVSYGLEPKRLDLFRTSGTKVRIEVFPAPNQLGAYNHKVAYVHACIECASVYREIGEHPENGCKVGVVEAVMEV